MTLRLTRTGPRTPWTKKATAGAARMKTQEDAVPPTPPSSRSQEDDEKKEAGNKPGLTCEDVGLPAKTAQAPA
ncbi:hypothetical protein RM609_10665 [Streptomyces sp. DSM 40473]|uniref:Uncharacterized protein n=1 Tax=Streptomyces hesseae TaxID=3075519 RepID=A0ABU2SKV3_9ACTN|nr:hypothetical protein [Streptomyces sp. DSM 40473]MDT0449527.1 hypothetical protein [Streptomyces sp. DSM 40473]